MDTLNEFFFSEKYCFYRNAAAILGTLFVARILLRELCDLVSGFRAFFLARLGIGTLDLKNYGSWAVVTGASEGIGRAYSLELAKRGLNVVLMSRSEEKLNKVATEIKEKYGRESLVIPVDFSEDFDLYAPLADRLSQLDIGVLINNVGLSYAYPDAVGNLPPQRFYNMVQLNCQPVVQMSRMLLPKMVSKGGGVIVNISSSASGRSMPEMCVYSATKIFVNYVSEGLRKEYKSKGIIVQNVMPFFVATAMSGIRRQNFIVPGPETMAKAAVASIGIQEDTYGCFSHAFQGYIMRRIPDFIFDRRMVAGAVRVRAAYFRRQAKEKAK